MECWPGTSAVISSFFFDQETQFLSDFCFREQYFELRAQIQLFYICCLCKIVIVQVSALLYITKNRTEMPKSRTGTTYDHIILSVLTFRVTSPSKSLQLIPVIGKHLCSGCFAFRPTRTLYREKAIKSIQKLNS